MLADTVPKRCCLCCSFSSSLEPCTEVSVEAGPGAWLGGAETMGCAGAVAGDELLGAAAGFGGGLAFSATSHTSLTGFSGVSSAAFLTTLILACAFPSMLICT